MSSASNAMFQNIGNTGSSSLGSVLPTSFNTSSMTTRPWLILGIVIVLVLIAYAIYYYYMKQDSSFAYANRGFWDSLLNWETKHPMPTVGIPTTDRKQIKELKGEIKDELTDELTDELKGELKRELQHELKYAKNETERERKRGEPQVEKIHHKRETWCFVGEDLTGRFCVKVPSEQSCDRDRMYESRSACELTSASHMPAGIITAGGAGMLPLSGNHF